MMENNPRTEISRFHRLSQGLGRRYTLLLWLVLMGAIVYLQWPMLKGLAYKHLAGASPKDSLAWETNMDAAAARAQEEGKPLLVDFSADWCPPCLVMKRDVWPDEAVRQAVEDGFIPVLIDVDRPDTEALSRQYEVATIPAVLVLDAQGRVIKRAGYLSAGSMVKFLRQAKEAAASATQPRSSPQP